MDGRKRTRLTEWDLHLQLPLDVEQGGGASGREQMPKLPRTTTLSVGFYCLGTNFKDVDEKSWNQKQRRWKRNIRRAFQEYALDILC